MIAVHGPHTWGQPFYAETDLVRVNLLGRDNGGWRMELKTTLLGSEFEWDFGDDSPPMIDGFEVIHTYEIPGTITITVTVQTPEGPRSGDITITLPDGGDGDEESEEMPKAA